MAGVGIAVARTTFAPAGDALADEVVEATGRIGGSVVVKLDAAGIAHKSDIGGVIVGVEGPDAVRAAVSTLLEAGQRAGAEVRGVLVQAMAEPGIEVIVGARRDAQFGPLVLVGLGGILAEALDDVAIRLAPVDRDEAAAMIAELRGAAILEGVRGRPAVDRVAVVDVVVALGAAMIAHDEWSEVDLNPVVAGPIGAVAVDALVVVEDGSRG
jgi:hypothetical protein